MAVGNAMNLVTTLAVYATIRKETGRPFQIPGSAAQWNGLPGVTDARMLARQLVWAGFDGTVRPLEAAMANDALVWREIATRHGLVETNLERLASPWRTDLDPGRPLEVMTDMANSRRLGFTACQPTAGSFFDLFARLRAGRLIP